MPELDDHCTCLHDYGDHSAKSPHRCLSCRCSAFRARPQDDRPKPSKDWRSRGEGSPDLTFVDGPDGSVRLVEPQDVSRKNTKAMKRIVRDLQEIRGCAYQQALNELRKLPEGTNWKDYVMSVAKQGDTE